MWPPQEIVLRTVITSDFDEALAYCSQDEKLQIFFETWIPRAKFTNFEATESGVTIVRDDNGPFAFAIGRNPPAHSAVRFSIDRVSSQPIHGPILERTEWESFYKKLKPVNSAPSEFAEFSNEQISTFLREHAPESSVFPGNEEILRWVTIDREGELVATAAICRWESESHVLSSVATKSNLRNAGLGTLLMKRVDLVAGQEGISRLCLGVISSNEAAKSLYRKAGWQQLFAFTYVEVCA